ncbi:hydroxylacyl-CoA dehydrogenase, partial [Streptomyces scabiei]
HSVDAGGTWVQLTRGLPGLAAPFHAFAAAVGVPVQHGTYDALYWENPAPGIHVLPPPDGTARPAAGSEDIGLSTWCAPQRYGGVTAIVEVPLWATGTADDLSPHPDPAGALRELAGLVRAVGFAMQPKVLPELRPAAEAYLRAHLGARTWRYFKKRRLTSLGLPGGIPARRGFLPHNSTARRVVRRARAVRRSIGG